MTTAADYRIEAILAAIEHAETHLYDECTVTALADAAHYSLFHFCRIFQQIAHLSPHDYLLRRRLTLSALSLSNTSRKIIEVGSDHGFQSPETFLRAFRRMFGILPSDWRKTQHPPTDRMLPRLTGEHLVHFRDRMGKPRRLISEQTLHSGLALPFTGFQMLASSCQRLIAQFNDPSPCLSVGLVTLPDNTAYLRMGFPGMDPRYPVHWHEPAGDYLGIDHHGGPEILPLSLDYCRGIALPGTGFRNTGGSWTLSYANPTHGHRTPDHSATLRLPIEPV